MSATVSGTVGGNLCITQLVRLYAPMVTLFRESGLRFVIFIDDHAPPHVHVFGDGVAKIELGTKKMRFAWSTRRE
jgi:hypothetical protein